MLEHLTLKEITPSSSWIPKLIDSLLVVTKHVVDTLKKELCTRSSKLLIGTKTN